MVYTQKKEFEDLLSWKVLFDDRMRTFFAANRFLMFKHDFSISPV